MKCPGCEKKLHHVGSSGALNSDQFDAVKAGDYFCEQCKGNRGDSGYLYLWHRELLKTVHVVCLNGSSRAGKDTFSSLLQEARPEFFRVAFGDKLRELALKTIPALREAYIARASSVHWGRYRDFKYCFRPNDLEIWDWLKQHRPETTAELVGVGEGCREVLGERIWWEQAEPLIRCSIAEGKSVVIPDLRDPSEVKDLNIFVDQKKWSDNGIRVLVHYLRVRRPGVENVGIDGKLARVKMLEVHNDGTKADFREKVECFSQSHLCAPDFLAKSALASQQ